MLIDNRLKQALARSCAIVVLLSTMPTFTAPPVHAEIMPSIDVIAVTGDPLPGGGDRTFERIGQAVINDNGDAAFTAFFEESGVLTGSALLRGNKTSVTLIARGGQPRGDGMGVLSFFEIPLINNAGQLSFRGTTLPDSSGLSEQFVYITDAETDELQIVAHRLGPQPSGGQFTEFGRVISINGAGQVAFQGRGTGGNGIYLGDADSLTEVHAASTTDPILNDAGQMAWVQTVSLSPSNNALFYYDETSVMEVARGGDPVPASAQAFTGVFPTASQSLNEAGILAFTAWVDPFTGGDVDFGLFVLHPTNGIFEPVVRHSVVPDGNGEYEDISNPFINNNNLIVFRGILENTTLGANDNQGLFLTDTEGSFVQQIAREEQPLPNGNGRFGDFGGTLSLNDNDQIVFFSGVRGSAPNPLGCTTCGALFLYDESMGIIELIREGDQLSGGTIQTLDGGFADFAPGTDEGRTLNNHGEVVFTFQLADGRRGIAIASVVPEPSTWLLIATALACTTFVAIRRVRSAE